jgi:hypothetical protein
MKGRVPGVLGLAALGAGLGGAVAAAEAGATPWLHIRVDEGRGAKVAVNLPMTVVDAALKAVPEGLGSHGRLHIGRHARHPHVSDLREVWRELRAADGEFLAREEGGERVSVSRKGEVVIVRVDRRGAPEVHVEVPVGVLDAFLSGEGDELNVRAGFSELAKGRGDVVRVKDDDTTVRIWVDEGNR